METCPKSGHVESRDVRCGSEYFPTELAKAGIKICRAGRKSAKSTDLTKVRIFVKDICN